MQISYAKADVPFSKVQRVQPSKDREDLTLVLKNGDRMEATTESKEIPFRTSFGEVKVAMKHIRVIRPNAPVAAAGMAFMPCARDGPSEHAEEGWIGSDLATKLATKGVFMEPFQGEWLP